MRRKGSKEYVVYYCKKMLVFRRGAWIDVKIPDYVDPSWGFGDRQKAASIVCDAMMRGSSFEEAWMEAEVQIYRGLGILRNPSDRRSQGSLGILQTEGRKVP